MPFFVNKNITAVSEDTFAKNKADDVRILCGTTEIQARAFAGWTRLWRIAFHYNSNLRVIGEYAFQGTALTTFLAPPSLQIIRSGAFANCAQLKEVVLNEGLTELGSRSYQYPGAHDGVFQYSGLGQISLPSTLRMVPQNTFTGCQMLKTVYYAQGSSYNVFGCVQNYALLNGNATQKNKFESQVKQTMKKAWATKQKQEHVENAEMLDYLVDQFSKQGKPAAPVKKAPQPSTDLLSFLFPQKTQHAPAPKPTTVAPTGPGVLRVPDNTECIRDTTFLGKNTQNVKIVVVPACVKKIMTHAFRGWEKLKEVQFEGNSKLEEIDGALVGAGIETFSAPESLRVLGQCAFYKCQKLRYVKLNEGLTVIGRDEISKDGSRYCGAF